MDVGILRPAGQNGELHPAGQEEGVFFVKAQHSELGPSFIIITAIDIIRIFIQFRL